MSPSEAALVDVVRLVARGEAESVPPRIGKLLHGAAGRRGDALSKQCRDALSRAIKEGESRQANARASNASARSATASADTDFSPLPPVDDDEASLAPVLDERAKWVLQRLIAEHREVRKLRAAGLSPTRSLLISGPPGVGKTMTATYLATSLSLPLLRAEPSTIVTSLLGESARNLAAAFQTARSAPSLLLLDEFDAFAKRRDDIHEVGELKRFVTTLLVELERGLPDGLLVAATNHPDLLDPAVHRRFDVILQLEVPSPGARRRILESAIQRLGVRVTKKTLDLVVELTEGQTGSDVQRLARDGVRTHLLEGDKLDFTLTKAAIPADPRTLSRQARARFARLAREKGGLSTREIGVLLSCSHTSVMRYLEPLPSAA